MGSREHPCPTRSIGFSASHHLAGSASIPAAGPSSAAGVSGETGLASGRRGAGRSGSPRFSPSTGRDRSSDALLQSWFQGGERRRPHRPQRPLQRLGPSFFPGELGCAGRGLVPCQVQATIGRRTRRHRRSRATTRSKCTVAAGRPSARSGRTSATSSASTTASHPGTRPTSDPAGSDRPRIALRSPGTAPPRPGGRLRMPPSAEAPGRPTTPPRHRSHPRLRRSRPSGPPAAGLAPEAPASSPATGAAAGHGVCNGSTPLGWGRGKGFPPGPPSCSVQRSRLPAAPPRMASPASVACHRPGTGSPPIHPPGAFPPPASVGRSVSSRQAPRHPLDWALRLPTGPGAFHGPGGPGRSRV